MTKLGDYITASQLAKPRDLAKTGGDANKRASTALATAFSGAKHYEPILVPLPGREPVPALMTLVGAARALDIEGEVLRAMEARGLVQSELTAAQYELERALRTLADAVRNADDRAQPFGSLVDWGALDPATINELWGMYGDLIERFDPADGPLTDEDIATIKRFLQKKSLKGLRSFGARRLAIFMLSTVDLPPSSPPPSSSDSPSSPD